VDGTVGEVAAHVGDQIAEGALIVRIEESAAEGA
jgi:pyruvate/2-oxoglutarate dehydrogenase complex dihydrolipoamide acyltransferase (E2) component